MQTMLKLSQFTLRFAIPLAIALGASSAWAQQSAPNGKANEVRIYIARDESARRVLDSLLGMFGKRLVTDSLPSRPVSGRFEVRSVEEVMAYFQSAYQINYFTSGNSVYVYGSDDWRTSRVYVGSERNNEDWKDMLTSAGLYYKDFPFVSNKENRELLVSGPRAYVKLVESAFGKPRPDPSEIEKHGVQLMVFPLKHASVEDRVTNLRGTSVVTPGALSVLLNLLGLPRQDAPKSGNGKSGPDSSAPNKQGRGDFPMIGDRMASIQSLGGDDPQSKEAESKKKELPLSVTADPRTNAILIRDAGTRYDYYKALIDQLDKPVDMIEVEAMLVEVDQQVLNELGLEFGLKNSNLVYDFPGGSVGRQSFVGIPAGASSIVDPVRFVARLRALSADENAKVLARPTIVTQDNVGAFIDLSQTLFLQLTGERVADVKPITAGSLLQVTPRVVREGMEEKIFLRVEIQDGSLTEQTGIAMPQIQNTALNTQALIQRDKAILIGGYNRESSSSKEYKVPVLGNLPWVGKAFTSEEKKSQTLARLFLITPKIVESPTHNGASTRKAVDSIQKNFPYRDPSLEPTSSLKMENRLSTPTQ